MKSQEELLSQFENIQDLPVSEETLGAYLEGNLEPEQMAEVYDYISGSDALQDLTAELYDIPEDVDVMSVLSPTDGLESDVVIIEDDAVESADDVVVVEDDTILRDDDVVLSDDYNGVISEHDIHMDDYTPMQDDITSDIYGDTDTPYDDYQGGFDF